jgi:hypothetical protein
MKSRPFLWMSVTERQDDQRKGDLSSAKCVARTCCADLARSPGNTVKRIKIPRDSVYPLVQVRFGLVPGLSARRIDAAGLRWR